MTWAVMSLSLAALGFAGTALVLAIRRAGLVRELEKAKSERDDYRNGLHDLKNELQGGELAAARDIRVLQKRVSRCKARIDDLPDTEFGRATIRAELDLLLQDTAD